jgi:potassium-transporting ATPase ATP-binding subunit
MKIVRRAAWDSLVKLHPVTMMRNPVMFVVEVGSVVTTVLLILERVHGRPGFGFNLQITLWLWFTVLFANFAEAMAEGRGKAQADALRRAKAETMANRLLPDGKTETVPGSNCARETWCWWRRESLFPAMARLWKAWRQWTSRRLRASRRR